MNRQRYRVIAQTGQLGASLEPFIGRSGVIVARGIKYHRILFSDGREASIPKNLLSPILVKPVP